MCTWERADLKAGISLSTHPPAAGAALVHSFGRQPSMHPHRIAIPGASTALVVTIPAGNEPAKALFAVFPHGVVQVDMTAPRRISDRRLAAIMALVTRG